MVTGAATHLRLHGTGTKVRGNNYILVLDQLVVLGRGLYGKNVQSSLQSARMYKDK